MTNGEIYEFARARCAETHPGPQAAFEWNFNTMVMAEELKMGNLVIIRTMSPEGDFDWQMEARLPDGRPKHGGED